MRKIVVFGATGDIGAYFVDYCIEHLDHTQYELIAVGRRHTSYFTKLGIPYYQIDIRNKQSFHELPCEEIYAIINMAGLLPAHLQKYDPFAYIDTNVIGGANILEYARRVGADRVLYTQTWAEMAGYWGKSEVLSPQMPRNLLYSGDHAFYAISKCMIVDAMKYYHQEYGIKDFVFRLPNIYLYSPKKTYFVDCVERPIAYRYMIDRAAAGLDIEMWGDPTAFKDVIYVKDLCQMMYKALFAAVDGGTYNAGTGIRTTLQQQIEGMIKVFSPVEKPSRIIEKPDKSNFTSFVMDIANAKQDLGYEPQYDYISYLADYKYEMEENRFSALWKG